ncbi:MAG: RsmB/NOP family class I SAM-dependent RNA methyltransferase [Victivallaceae bacterium]|nr:RsmB/NOP family class I SAM-dependent RNA methyltransferase [Victivallaceae bacterium]
MGLPGDGTPAAVKILDASVEGLERWEEKGTGIDDFLEYQLKYPETRRSVAAVLSIFFRRKQMIDFLLRKFSRQGIQPYKRRILEVAVTQMLFCREAVPVEVAVSLAVDKMTREAGVGAGKFANALLRRISAEPPEISDAPEAVLPPEVRKHWKKLMPRRMKDMAAVFLTKPDFCARACVDAAAPEGARPLEFDFCGKFRFYRIDNPREFLASPEFSAGDFYIQDPATAMALSLFELSGNEKVCDLCAAPGGKGLMIAERLNRNGAITLFDRSEARQNLTRENFSRRRIEAQYRIEVCEAANVSGEFDLVFCDVPCSNTGVFRRRPDALWRFSPSRLLELTGLQKTILGHAAALVRPGGRLVYSTCSIEPDENGAQTAGFIASHQEFTLLSQRQLLPTAEFDGAYAAVMRKNK